MALEIGWRFERKGILLKQSDIFHCALVEIFSILSREWNGTGLSAIVEDRKSRFKGMETFPLQTSLSIIPLIIL